MRQQTSNDLRLFKKKREFLPNDNDICEVGQKNQAQLTDSVQDFFTFTYQYFCLLVFLRNFAFEFNNILDQYLGDSSNCPNPGRYREELRVTDYNTE